MHRGETNIREIFVETEVAFEPGETEHQPKKDLNIGSDEMEGKVVCGMLAQCDQQFTHRLSRFVRFSRF